MTLALGDDGENRIGSDALSLDSQNRSQLFGRWVTDNNHLLAATNP